MDFNIYGTCYVDDCTGARLLLRWACEAEERFGDDDAVLFCTMPHQHSVDIMGL